MLLPIDQYLNDDQQTSDILKIGEDYRSLLTQGRESRPLDLKWTLLLPSKGTQPAQPRVRVAHREAGATFLFYVRSGSLGAKNMAPSRLMLPSNQSSTSDLLNLHL